jgi:hypothetical protein
LGGAGEFSADAGDVAEGSVEVAHGFLTLQCKVKQGGGWMSTESRWAWC